MADFDSQAFLQHASNRPGVYRMLDADGETLYVGKAKNLKKRLSNYFRASGLDKKTMALVARIHSIETTITRSETEALLLEQNLIKEKRPPYNIVLRDDKSYPYIFLSSQETYPRFALHRGSKKLPGEYYGPFPSASAVRESLAVLQKVFHVRQCEDSFFRNRTRPCLQYQIKRCAAPCVGKVDGPTYAALVQDAELFLQGKTTAVQADLAKQMSTASEAMEFERAASLRDRIKALTQVQQSQGINPRGVEQADVIALHLDHGQACVQVFFIRAHQSWGNRDFYPKTGAGAEEPEIMEAFLAQFYDDKDPPPLILLSHPVENPDLVGQLLSERAGRKVELAVPLRGEKAELLENAARNARESLARRMSESSTQNTLLRGLAEAFDLDAPPMRIEVYDNAHIQGSDAVGGMIVAGAEGFLKSQYRKFNIKSAAGANSDDFGMMREVMTRRFERLLKEDPDRKSDAWPDLLLIDGGAGQISAVAGILADLGVEDIAVVGVAKGIDRDAGKEEFHRTGLPVMALPRNDPVLYFIQRLRDEAHRWANGAHRAKRAKAVSITPLDDIPGVGAMRKRALLAHFGSAKAVSRAGVPDLMAVEGISQAMAETIHEFFNPG